MCTKNIFLGSVQAGLRKSTGPASCPPIHTSLRVLSPSLPSLIGGGGACHPCIGLEEKCESWQRRADRTESSVIPSPDDNLSMSGSIEGHWCRGPGKFTDTE